MPHFERESLVEELLARLELEQARVARLEAELETCVVERDLLRAEVEAATAWARALAERVNGSGQVLNLRD